MSIVEFDYIVFEWDDNKNASNKIKHGLSFETALFAFFDEKSITLTDFVKDGEQRWKTLGKLPNDSIILFIGHLVYDDETGREVIRIITARQATKNEEREYYVSY